MQLALLCLLCLVTTTSAQLKTCAQNEFGEVVKSASHQELMRMIQETANKCQEDHMCPQHNKVIANTPCSGGGAGGYRCMGIDINAVVPLEMLGPVESGIRGNDIWGWTSSDGTEIAVVGTNQGTSFVDVTKPTAPVVKAWLPRTEGSAAAVWRDVKVHNGHAYIVADSSADLQGMQVYDMTQLASLKGVEVTPAIYDKYNATTTEEISKVHAMLRQNIPVVKATYLYTFFGDAHNIVINEETNRAYGVGCSIKNDGKASSVCKGGLAAMDISDPSDVKWVGCYEEDCYTHDAQCQVYRGPDKDYQGREICYNYNEDTLTIVDVTDSDPANWKTIFNKRGIYSNIQYTHQGWTTPDEKYLFLNDELDEVEGTDKRTRSLVFNIEDLDAPYLYHSYFAKDNSIDHNLYMEQHGESVLSWEANYADGLRVLRFDVSAPEKVQQVAYLDTCTQWHGKVEFHGAWSNYPYFNSGTKVVQDIEEGLFVLSLEPGLDRRLRRGH